MAYIKLKELTKYFDFKHEVDIRKLPYYVMEYINELYCFGPNTVCKVEKTDLMEDAAYLRYTEASKKTAQDIFEGKHIVSRYDVNYNK